MGSGIATACAHVGIVRPLIDSHAEGIERGVAVIALELVNRASLAGD